MLTKEEVKFTEQEFLFQVTEFHKLMGSKSFWAQPREKREIAQKALGYAYLLLGNVSKEIVERCANILDSTLAEYGRREFMILTTGGTLGK